MENEIGKRGEFSGSKALNYTFGGFSDFQLTLNLKGQVNIQLFTEYLQCVG